MIKAPINCSCCGRNLGELYAKPTEHIFTIELNLCMGCKSKFNAHSIGSTDGEVGVSLPYLNERFDELIKATFDD